MRLERQEKYKQLIENTLENKISKDRGRKGFMALRGKLTKDNLSILNRYYIALQLKQRPTRAGRKAASYATFYEYLRNIRRFGVFIGEKCYLDVDKKDLNAYVAKYSMGSLCTLNGVVKSLKTFFTWLYYDEGKIKKKEIPEILEDLEVDRPQPKKKNPDQLLNGDDVLKLIKIIENPRDKAIVAILFESGCRVGELIDLNLEDVSFDEYGAFIYISESKTEKRKLRLIISEPYIKQYINSHPLRDKKDTPLFYCFACRDFGKRMTSAGVRFMLIRWAERAGIDKPINPHAFRHTCLDLLAKQGWTERDIMIRAGWKSTQMAKVYLHYGDDHVNEKYEKLMGINKGEPKEEINVLAPVICPRCNKNNPPDSMYCNCGMILSIKELNKIEQFERKVNNFTDKLSDAPIPKNVEVKNMQNSGELTYDVVMNTPELKKAFLKLFKEYKEIEQIT
jgi:integrase/recombinase XerD